MKEIVTYANFREVDLDFNIDVSILGARIVTTRNLKLPLRVTEKGKKYLCIYIETEIDSLDWHLIHAPLHVRPRLLIIYGLLSFFTGDAFTSFELLTTSTNFGQITESKKEKFKIGGNNFIKDFRKIKKLIQCDDERTRTFYSLLDRYRKAIFLENEGGDDKTFDDEAILSYFHIIELLAEEYHKRQKEITMDSISEFVRKVLVENLFFDQEEEIIKKTNLFKELMSSNINVLNKILFMLNEQGLLNPRLKSFIKTLIEDRNSVAHGRKSYKGRFKYITPFFSITDPYYSFDILKIIAGRVIAIYFELGHLKEEWEEIENEIPPSKSEIKKFIRDKKFESLSFESSPPEKHAITPTEIERALINRYITTNDAILALSSLIMNDPKINDRFLDIFSAITIIVDDAVEPLKSRCIKLIDFAIKKDLYFVEDWLFFLQQLDFQPKELEKMIEATRNTRQSEE